MLILAFESSCDETSVAIASFENGEKRVLANKTATQIAIHALYGGVVPEIAGRAHIEAISALTYAAFEEAGVTVADIDAVAVTSEPGLIGALLVAVNYAKSFALAHDLPLIPVNHIRAHIAAVYYEHPDLEAPFFAMVASGGHTSLINVKNPTTFETVGRTRDDAIGEAFDKVARVLGMPYPGGAEMDRLAKEGNPKAIRFPTAAMQDSLDFSFSGLKTAVINYIHTAKQRGEELSLPDIAASFTEAVLHAVITNLEKAKARYDFDTMVLAGGVAANSHLRRAVAEFCQKKKIRLCLPSLSYCGDNGAMIAAQGYHEFLAGKRADSSLNAKPTVKGAN